MKKREYKVHILYGLTIAMLLLGATVVVMLMRNKEAEWLNASEEAQMLDREQLVGTIGQAESALRLAAYTVNPTVYAAKMQTLAESCAGAAVLTEQHDPASAWSVIWVRLRDFAEQEIADAVEKKVVTPNGRLLAQYADLLAKLREEPSALEGPLWEDLPEGLTLPKLQTEFSIGEEKLKEKASSILRVGGLLRKAESGLPGIVRYRCSNAEIDLLMSGKLVYFDLQLSRQEGNIGRSEGVRRLNEFVKHEGYAGVDLLDLYENDGILWARMVPSYDLTPLGKKVKDLDHPIYAACTLWSGRICHFEVDMPDGLTDHAAPNGGGQIAHTGLLSEAKLKKLADEKNAELGEAVICKGRLCRTLTLNDRADGRTICIYVDAIDGSERDLALRTLPSEEELPVYALLEDGESRLPIELHGVLYSVVR